MKLLFALCLLFSFSMVNFTARAQSPSPQPAVTAAPVAPPEVQPVDFLGQVFDFVKKFGGLTGVAKVTGLVLLLIASMKVTVLNQWIWQKLGEAQALVAPGLGVLAGLLGLFNAGQPVTWPSVFTYLVAGGGAIFVHEILDALKALPGLGAVYVSIIDLISKSLGGAQPTKV